MSQRSRTVTTIGIVGAGPASGTGRVRRREVDARPSDEAADRDRDYVQSLDRGLAVIRAFGPGRERLTLSEVARETGLTRAASRRFLLTLVSLGYVCSDAREFSLSPRVLELGYSYMSSLVMPETASRRLKTPVASAVSRRNSVDVDYALAWLARKEYAAEPLGYITRLIAQWGTVEQMVAFITAMRTAIRSEMPGDDPDGPS